jgi:ubiquinone/menaquinone biosynthesis C-methylase UbiE
MRVAALSTLVFCLIAVAPSAPAAAQDRPSDSKSAEKTPAKTKAKSRRSRGGAATYMGRPIAPVMGFEGAEWLFRDTREQEEQPDKMLDALEIQPGHVVADVGAGAGYISLRLARRVGPSGKVLATDLQPQMLQMLTANARAAGIKNIQPIRCTPSDQKLPESAVDLAIMVDVYHECSEPEATLQGLWKALKPAGRLVLVEFRAEDPDVPIKPEHKMTLAQVRREIEPQGFVFKQSLEFLPWQHLIIFEKGDEAPGKSANTKKTDASQPKQTQGRAK